MHPHGTCMGWNAKMLFYFVGVIINFFIISIIPMRRGIWTRDTFSIIHSNMFQALSKLMTIYVTGDVGWNSQ